MTLEDNVKDIQSTNINIRYIRHYKKGGVVFQEGSRGKEMYVINSGRIKIVKKDSKDTDQELSILESGDIFGEMALIDQGPRSATAIAVDDDTSLIELDRTRFMYLIRHQPEFALIVMGILCERVREKNAQYASLLELTDLF